MSATNSTPIINLPLFIGTDKPAWLTDWNGAMNTIDTAIANLQTAESGTATSLASLAQSVEALSGTVSQHTTAIQTVTTATAGNTGSINTINSLIGNGEPTTTDKTIIGAINEIYADIGGGDGVDADEVNYDNTTSGLTATNVQAAIDEIAQSGPSSVDADDVSYDNQTSGLTATNVQAAIDYLAGTNKVSVTADGTKTTATLLNELFALIDISKIRHNSSFEVLATDGRLYHYGLNLKTSSAVSFVNSTIGANNKIVINEVNIKVSNSTFVVKEEGTTLVDNSSNVLTSGNKYTIIY